MLPCKVTIIDERATEVDELSGQIVYGENVPRPMRPQELRYIGISNLVLAQRAYSKDAEYFLRISAENGGEVFCDGRQCTDVLAGEQDELELGVGWE
jgi:hypothetical protein